MDHETASSAKTTSERARRVHAPKLLEGTGGPLARTVAGGVLVITGARRGGLLGVLLAVAGGLVLRRALRELFVHVRDEIFAERPDLERRYGENQDRDVVEEASWESFPASDPPGFTH